MKFVGEALIALRREREAIVLLERALQLATAAGRRREKGVLRLLDTLGRAYLAAGETDRAQVRLDEALAVAQQRLPANNLCRAQLERSMGDLRLQQGRDAQARIHYRFAERVFSQGFGKQHRWAVEVRQRLHRIGTTQVAAMSATERLDVIGPLSLSAPRAADVPARLMTS